MDPNDVLRKRFEAIDAAALEQMLDREEPEGLQLDFKQMSPDGEPTQDDQKNLKKAISGFANSAGGIILWGVTSKQGREETSCFSGYVLVRDSKRALRRFGELSGEATDRPVNGVVHEAIRVAEGYVIKTLVPASDETPHRTRERKGQYYKRWADRFQPMEHFEIADMFGRRARPQLEFVFSSGKPGRFMSAFGLRNVGRGLARFPFVAAEVLSPEYAISEYGLDGNGHFGLKRLPRQPGTQGEVQFGGGMDDVIHPGTERQIAEIRPTCMIQWAAAPRLIIRVRFVAEGVPEQVESLDIDMIAEYRRHH